MEIIKVDVVDESIKANVENVKVVGTGGGTSDYNQLTNLPTINNVTLKDNVTTEQLGILDDVNTYIEEHKDDFKGETGDSGVYIGNEEPTNDANVWVDTDENPTDVLSREEVEELIDESKVSIITPDMTTLEIEPNKYYQFGEVTELNITLKQPTDTTILNEYMFEFVSGETATTLTLPNTIKWLEEPSIEADKTYQCSIVNNIGVLLGV